MNCLFNERSITEEQKVYGVQPILTAKIKQERNKPDNDPYVFDEHSGCYHRNSDEGTRQATLLCTGLIEYDRKLEADAESFGNYEFLRSIKPAAACFGDADFIIGSMSTMASVQYPSIGDVPVSTIENGYRNCRIEFVEALKTAGFTALAAANVYNAGLGIDGLIDTENTIKDSGIISTGIGYKKNSVVEINGIKIGLVSITAECYNYDQVMTTEGADKFLNIYDTVKTKEEIDLVKDKGAEFILAYVYCSTQRNPMSLAARKVLAEEIAELGADYIICSGIRVLAPYYRYTTEDGRNVPIATSLGSFISGRKAADDVGGAVIKLTLGRDFSGGIYIDDRYIPIKKEQRSAVGTALGEEIALENGGMIKSADPYTNTLTIAEIYECLGKKPKAIDLKHFGDKYDQPVSCVALRKEYMLDGGAAVMLKYEDYMESKSIEWDIQDCVTAGISLVIDNVYHDELPCIVVEEPLIEVFAKLAKTVKDRYEPFTVAITGSMGKTTTKEMAAEVFNTELMTFVIGGNINSIYGVGRFMQKLDSKYQAYVQEVHGGTPKSARYISETISPDICIITNIVKNHMSQVGTIENLVNNKLDIVKGLKEDGIAIICNDNEYLKAAKLPCKTIRYSIEDATCQYYAKDIIQEDGRITFDIVSNESLFDDAGVYPAVLNLQGKHNVGNALAVYAAARQAGIPPYKIIAGLAAYRATGIRQNIFEHGGIRFMLDTYNSNPKALIAMMDVFAQTSPKEGGKKVLVIGMMGEQGDDSPKIHYETGKELCDYEFDLMYCFGEDAKYIADAVNEKGKEAYYFEDREELNKAISSTVHPGDVLMVKGSRFLQLDTDTLVPIYGKSIRKK